MAVSLGWGVLGALVGVYGLMKGLKWRNPKMKLGGWAQIEGLKCVCQRLGKEWTKHIKAKLAASDEHLRRTETSLGDILLVKLVKWFTYACRRRFRKGPGRLAAGCGMLEHVWLHGSLPWHSIG